MYNIWKRSLSFFLAVVMVFGMLPMPARAVEDGFESLDEVFYDETSSDQESTFEEIYDEEDLVDDDTWYDSEGSDDEGLSGWEDLEGEEDELTLSGETRKIYFFNVESWETVWASWSFEEEEFEDEAFPGVELTEDEVLANAYVLELPVEADEVCFSDGLELTEELLAAEAEAGLELTHQITAVLDEELDVYDASIEAEEERWLSYNQLTKTDDAVAAVQAMIDSLPATVNSQEEYDAVYAIVDALDEGGYIDGLTEDQLARAQEAIDAADLWYTGEEAANYATEKEILDGKTTDKTVLNWVSGTATQTQYKINNGSYTTLWGSDSEISVSHGDTVYVRTGWNIGFASGWNDPKEFTIKVYHNVTATVDSAANAEGAGEVTATGKVYHNEKAVITVTGVDDYKAELYNGTTKVAELSDEAGWTYTIDKATASVAYTVKYVSTKVAEYPVTLKVENGDWGTASLGTDKGIANAEIALTVNPKAVTGNAMYTYDVDVENGSYANGKVTIDGTGNVVVTVTFNEETMEYNSNPEVLVNGYDKDTITSNLKAKLVSAVLKNPGATTNYDVYVYLGFGSWEYVNLDDAGILNTVSGWLTNLGRDFWIKVNGTINVKIVEKATGRTVVTDVATNESREPATITLGTLNASWQNIQGLKDDVYAKLNVLDNDNKNIDKSNVTITASEKNAEGKVTVTAKVSKDGATWLTSEDYSWEISFKYNQYKTTFVDHNGNTMFEKYWDNESTPTYGGQDMVAYYNAMDTAEYDYTFTGWDNDTATEGVSGIVALNGADVTYTAAYTQEKKTYDVTWQQSWVNEEGATVTKVFYTEQVEYGKKPSFNEYKNGKPSRTSDAQYNYSWDGWDQEITEVTGDITYTAVFEPVLRSYNIKWVNGDKTENTTVAYGEMPVPPSEASKSPKVDENGVQIESYVCNWPEVTKVTGEATYKAEIVTVPTEYTITWMANGNAFATQKDAYGTDVKLPEGTPADYVDDNGTNWTFDKWEVPADLGTIAGDKSYEAVYKQSGNDAKIIRNGQEIYCKNLAVALNEAVAGDTIVMLADYTATGKITVSKNVTIDGDNHSIIVNHTGYILETTSDCEIKNVKIVAQKKGIRITSGNIVFDNVAIEGTKEDVITLFSDSTLELKTKFTVDNSANVVVIDARKGNVTVAEGTVFDVNKWFANASMNSDDDLRAAVGTDGEPFFVGYTGTTYYTSLSILPNGLVLLKDATINGATVSNKITIDLNGNTLTVANGKTINVNKGQLVIKNGTVKGAIVMNDVGDSVVAAKDAVTVTISADLAERGYECVYEEANGYYCVVLPVPDAIITDIKDELTDEDPALTFALNFAFPTDLDEAYVNELFDVYGEWYTDYALTITGLNGGSVKFNSDGSADGYLAGQYDAWSENWVTVPFGESVTVNDGESILIMETAGRLLGQSGLRMTLNEIANIVTNFDCGVYFTPEFLAANPDLKVELELRVFAEEEKHGYDYVISLATNKFENNSVAVIDAEGKQPQYFGTLAAAAEAAAEGDIITLLKIAGDASFSESVTIATNGYNVGTLTIAAEDVEIIAPAGLNVNDTVDGKTVVYKDGKYVLVADENNNDKEDSTEKYTVSWVVDGKTTTETYTYGDTPSFKGSTNKATANYIKYTFSGWDATPSKVVADVTYTAQYSMELLANNGSFTMNGYYEARGNMDEIIKTLKSDVLNAAGLPGQNASNYTVTMKYSLGNLDLDKLTGWTNGLNATAFFTAIELPESGRQFQITDNATGASKTVTMKIEDSRPSAGLVSKEFTDVKVLDKNDNPTDYINTLLAQVNPNGLNVNVTLTDDTKNNWPPAKAGDTVKLVYTVSYESDANWIGGSATLTVYLQSLLNNCTVVPGTTLTAGGSLTVNGSNDNKTVAGNSAVSITVKPNSDKVVETITVYNNGVEFATFTTDKISYSSKNATVSFKSDGTEIADVYTVEVTYSDNYLNLKSGTIVYCVDNDDLSNDELKALVFEGIFDGSSAPMNAGNVTLEYAYIGVGGYNLWQDISKGPTINLGSLTHKFGEDGSETIRIKYSDDKYGSFEQKIELNVFDSCYSAQVGIQTIAPEGTKYNFSVKYSADGRKFQDVTYFKQGEALTVTLTPSGDDIGAILQQLYNKTYSETAPYIKGVKVMKMTGNTWTEVTSTLERGNGELIDWDNILGGVGNPFAYTAAVTFTPEEDGEYKIVAEYDVLKLERTELSAQLDMYQAGKGYEAEVPSKQEIYEKILGKAYAENFRKTYGGAFTVEFSTDFAAYNWTAVSDEALLALNDGQTIRIRITWNPTDDNKTYYPVSQQANLTLVDTRKATSVQGSVPKEKVEYVEESQLVANLKEAMGLGILHNGNVINVEYDVHYSITATDDGNSAKVIVTYPGSKDYKPTSETFEDVPVADIPDNATIKVTIQNASDVVTNNAGSIMPLDPSTGIYTVIGNGTYNFQFTPVTGKAIESVTVNGEKLENVVGSGKATQLFYKDGVATFTLYLEEKANYEIVVETVESVWGLDDERVYDFATGISTADNGKIADAATNYPADIDFDRVKLEYLAREEGKVTITLPDIDLGVYVIDLGTFDVELGELWLNPEDKVEGIAETQLDKILEKLVEDLPGKVVSGEVALNEALDYVQNYVKNLPLGIHAFGAEGDGSTETVRFSYADDKYTLAEVTTDVTIKDYRIATEIVANDCEVSYGYSLQNLIDASGAAVHANGAAVSGLKIETENLYQHAGERTVTLTFAGDETYQPAKITLNVTVNKATVSVDYDSQIITYGDNYKFAIAVDPETLPDGTNSDPELIEFMIGLDAHELVELDLSNKNEPIKLGQSIGFIQLRLPKVIRDLPVVGEYLQGEFTLSSFTELINSLSDTLGIDESSMEILNQVVEAITGITDRLDVKVIVKDEEFHPKNMGVYIAGAVTIDADFETAYTADYLIIKPQTTEVELAWENNELTNAMVTLPMFQSMNIGAKVADGNKVNDNFVNYLILGVNTEDAGDEESKTGILSTDIYGKIKANIWLNATNKEIKDNGAYLQIAFGVQWGNEFKYAVPMVRSFAIVPAFYTVELVGATGTHNQELLKKFNGDKQGFSIRVTDNEGNIVYSDHYQDKVEQGLGKLRENAQLIVNYAGVQTNGKIYNSTEKPVHAGAYVATAVYMEFNDGEKLDISNLSVEDLYELFDLVDMGADVGLLVIEPSESTIEMKSFVNEKFEFEGYNVNDVMNIKAKSDNAPAEFVTEPDKTVITAAIASTNDFTVNGWDAVTGSVNVDFPAWIDGVLESYKIKDGITASELAAKLERLESVEAKLAELNVPEELIDALNTATSEVSQTLAQMPDNVKVTFQDNYTVNAVGAYAVVAIVTDSDHYPSVDAGVLVITPDVKQVYLKWNYEDENGIWTRSLQDLAATAYDNADYTGKNKDATEKISYKFIGLNSDAELVVYDSVEELRNGAYIQLAYIELEINGEIVVSDLIARELLAVPGVAKVTFVDEKGNENNDRLFTFDNTAKTMTAQVEVDGKIVKDAKVTYTYAGVQTNGKEYIGNEAPKHAGAYTVIADYVDYDKNGSVAHVGTAIGAMVIEPAQSTIEVTGKTVTYDGNGHTAEVVVNDGKRNADYTLISGGVSISGDADAVGVDAFHGNVNIDFPRWLEEALKESGEFEFIDGVDAAYLVRFIKSYREDLIKAVTVDKLVEWDIVTEEQQNAYVEKLNAYIDQLIAVLNEMPKDVKLTFEDSITYTEPGAYFYYGVITDSDHYPSTDTGLLVIEKAEVTVTMDSLSKIYGAEDPALTYTVEGLVSDNELTVVASREKGENVGEYTITAEASHPYYNVTIVPGTFAITKAPVTVKVDNQTKVYGDEDPTFTATAEGLVNGDTLEDLNIQFSREDGENAGTYAITATASNDNYVIKVVDGTLVIDKAIVSVKAENATKVYGDADPEFKATVTGMKNDETLNVTFTREEGKNVGEYNVYPAFAENGNYVIIGGTGKLTITPAKATITVADQTKVYGESDPEFTAKVEGLKFEDKLDIEFSRETGEDVGKYIIKASAEDDNYDITVNFGTLTITKAPVTISVDNKTKVYGDTEPEFTAKVEGLKYEDELAIEFSRETGENVGKYIIKASAEDDNYDITVNFGTLTIEKAPVTITVDSLEKIYGETDPELTAVVEGVKNGEKLAIELSRETGEDVGEYIIKASAEDDNYDITITFGKLTIKPVEVTVTVNNAEAYYGNEIKFTNDNDLAEKTANGDKTELKVTYTFFDAEGNKLDKQPTDAGTYTYTAEANVMVDNLVSKNYNVTVKYADEAENGKLDIKKAELTIEVGELEKQFDLADPDFTKEENAYKLTTVKGDVSGILEALNIQIVRKVDKPENETWGDTAVLTATYTENPNVTVNVVDGKLNLTLGDYVCWNIQTGKYYAVVNDGLEEANANETVQLLKDVTVAEYMLLIKPYITLDLNGYDVSAEYVVGMNYSDVIDSLDNYWDNIAGGVLVVPRENMILAIDNDQLPIWNAENGYVFSTLYCDVKAANCGLTTDNEADTATIGFVPWFDYGDESFVKYNDAAGNHYSGIKAVVRMTWTVYNDDGTVNCTQKQDCEFDDQMLDNIVTAAGSRGLRVTFSHISELKDLSMTILVKSDRNVELARVEYQIS